MIPLLVLRPEPGNAQTIARAQALGLDAISCPLFAIEPVAHTLPDPSRFDAMLVTSANAARHGEDVLAAMAGLPLYAVGEVSARATGRRDAIVGTGDIAGTLPLLHDAGRRSVLHLCGTDVRPYDAGDIAIERLAVYRAAIRAGASADLSVLIEGERLFCGLIHSPRAGALFGEMVPAQARPRTLIVAISPAAAAACGAGWQRMDIAPDPSDEAMLALATRICKDAGAIIKLPGRLP